MIRVIIADDEYRICRLIIKLIDWDKLGMEVIGTANNGVETIELIKKEKPDIVITDIRMPGYDGLEMIEKAKIIDKDIEFIIISGYNHFEYAKRAIGYGVKDYLLKPINQEELINTLLRIKEDIIKKKGYIDLENEYKYSIINDRFIIRKSFLDNLINVDTNNPNQNDLEILNNKYYYNFKPFIFRVIALKLDYKIEEPNVDIKELMERTMDTICSSLRSSSYDIEGISKVDNSTILINYNDADRIIIQDKLLKILADFQSKIIKTKNINLTIGYGEAVNEIKNIKTSFDTAKLSIENRIVVGTGRLILNNEIETDKDSLKEIFIDFSRLFVKTVERLNKDKIHNSLMDLKKRIEQISIGGRELKILILDIATIYDATLKSNNLIDDYTSERYKIIEKEMEKCLSLGCLFDELERYITETLTLLEEDRATKNMGQIGQAKKYIELNYMNSITLEDVGNHIGFNPSYFSSLFKKETGTYFVDYLSQIRIEKAKVLLKEPDLRIQDICLMVGYSDVKYFSKLFIKHTGLKPNEYRKIFV